MRTFAVLVVATMAVGATACGGRTTGGYSTSPTMARMTSAEVTFFNRDEGKDEDSAVLIEVMRGNAELAAEARAVGVHWEHDESSGPVGLRVHNAFTKDDIADGRVRIRLLPDGRDTWKFDMRMTAHFSDGTRQTFYWNDLRLEHNSPERLLPLGPARTP